MKMNAGLFYFHRRWEKGGVAIFSAWLFCSFCPFVHRNVTSFGHIIIFALL
jgi:hypothetical protein